MVEASWEDQSGTLQRERARMENTSNFGARIRVKKQIDAGARLRVQWRWEQFSGVARCCLKDGIDYFVGIQRDAKRSEVRVLRSQRSLTRWASFFRASGAGKTKVLGGGGEEFGEGGF
jgi:hypothetical protein